DSPVTPSMERWIAPWEIGPSMEACMSELGFAVVSKPDGQGYSPRERIATDQVQPYHAAVYECVSCYSLDPKYSQALTPDQLGVMHEYFTDVLIPCLADQGHEITDVPTREMFVGNYSSNPWSPWLSPGLEDSHLQASSRLACPERTLTEAMYG
ncbi:MAG: hypothetical protein Q4F65_13630, partial [Propionibacteriaceae bacterium]|nr:hypothetical protein [Propionibacteriaceae bacterium]